MSADSSAGQDIWTVDTSTVNAAGELAAVAVVTAASGDELRVYQDSHKHLYMSLRVRSGFERLDTTICPTFEVVTRESGQPATSSRCQVDPGGARFHLGQIQNQQVASDLLLALMRGNVIVFRLHFTRLGYRQMQFSLEGSKQALSHVLGPDIGLLEALDAVTPGTGGP